MKIAMFGLKGIPYTAGVETVVEELGSRLADRGHEVVVFVRPQYTPRSSKEYRGMRLVNLPSIPTKNLDAISHSFLSAFGSIATRPDIVHIQATGNSIYAFLPRWFGIPTVVTSHGLDWRRAKWGGFAREFLKFTDYTTCKFPSATVAVGQKLQQYYQEAFKRNVFYIPNGANPVERIEPNEILKFGLHGEDYLLFASRLVPEKGCHYLIEAYKKLNTDKKLVIAGDGVTDDEYVKSLKKEANPNIIFLGFIRGNLLRELLSNAYLYILPSEVEGLSVGLIEAMSYHNCVLVSDIEENREVLHNSGFTFINKSVEDLALKLENLLREKELVDQQKKICYESVIERYNWEKITDQYEDLYNHLLGRK